VERKRADSYQEGMNGGYGVNAIPVEQVVGWDRAHVEVVVEEEGVVAHSHCSR
jgi:hypothetical protein